MIDDNLPTFQFRASSDDPDSSVLYFSQNGSEPSPEYVFKRADPASQPSCRGSYAVGLVDALAPGVVYGEVLVSPEWQQPTLSAAEIRAQSAVAAPPVPVVPDTFAVQLYDPDQTVSFKMVPGSWGKSDAWEFEMPTRSFRLPSASQLDRQQSNTPPAGAIAPKVMFKWKRDGRLSKDMTCYLAGRSLGRHKSKEPDITVALFKQGRESLVTIYEPNLQRVEVEDRKGLDMVLLLGAEVIRDLYLSPRPDVFNIAGPDPARARKGSRTTSSLQNLPPAQAAVMSGALEGPSSAGGVDLETRRLQAMVEREQREREQRDAEEQRRIEEMLEQEEARERQRREAEIAMETERLRQMYGTEGQDLPSTRPGLPPRAQNGRPLSAGGGGQAGTAVPAASSPWWRGGSNNTNAAGPVSSHQPRPPPGGPYAAGSQGRNPSASISSLFNRDRDDNGKRLRSKRSVHF